MSLTVYLDGQFLPYDQASIPVEDRAFLFADGIYEVVRTYGGRPFAMSEHMARLQRSAQAIGLPPLDLAHLERVAEELLTINNLSDATVYIQVSRGAYAPRSHAFPQGPAQPTILLIARPFLPTETTWSTGSKVITVPDQRWARCDIKSVSLLPNILAKQQAAEAGAYEAIFVKDGYAIEGSSSNFMALIDGTIRTYPLCNYILGGITRDVVLGLAKAQGIPVREEGVLLSDLPRCSELWVTSTTSEVMPIVQIDSLTVGDGRPGPVATRLLHTLRQKAQAAQ